MFRRRRHPRLCPRYRNRLVAQHKLWVCTQCLLIWHGDTFEPLSRDALGVASLYDYFFRI